MIIDPYNAIKLSIIVGLSCVVLGFPFALFLGWLLAKKQFIGKTILTLVTLLPLSLPPIVSGLLILKFLGRDTFFGQLFESIGLPITFSLTGAVLSSYIVGFPLYVMMIRSAFETVDKRFEEVVLTLGLSPIKVFFKITLPLAFPGILAGAVISFARAMGEFGATSIVAGNMEGETRTISLALYSLFEMQGQENSSLFLILISVVISFISIALYEYFNRVHKKRLKLHE